MWWIKDKDKNPIDITLDDTRYGAWMKYCRLTGKTMDALITEGYRATTT